MADIRDGKLIYHLTDITNLEAIFSQGLKPRSLLKQFSDVADAGIIESRRTLRLEECVPFHFFAKNPFDGRVHRNNVDKKFALITVLRSHAQTNNWHIIPRHPLAGTDITLLSYEAGIKTIDWDTMERRAYLEDECRHVCMAECLSPTTVPASDFYSIYVPDEGTEQTVNALKKRYKLTLYVNYSPNMFPEPERGLRLQRQP